MRTFWAERAPGVLILHACTVLSAFDRRVASPTGFPTAAWLPARESRSGGFHCGTCCSQVSSTPTKTAWGSPWWCREYEIHTRAPAGQSFPVQRAEMQVRGCSRIDRHDKAILAAYPHTGTVIPVIRSLCIWAFTTPCRQALTHRTLFLRVLCYSYIVSQKPTHYSIFEHLLWSRFWQLSKRDAAVRAPLKQGL